MIRQRYRLWLLLTALLLIWGDLQAREIRYLSFSAKSRHNIFIRDLKLEEVELTLDGKPIEVGYLGYREVDTACAILLENTPRTAPHAMSMPQWGQVNPIDLIRYQMQDHFFRPLTETGPVLLGEFFTQVEVLRDFTTHEDELILALLNLQPRSAGIVFENIEVGGALGRGVDFLRHRPERRKVLVLFTITVDRQSYGNLEEYQQMLRHSDIDLYAISFAPRHISHSGAAFEERMNTFFFRSLAAETGGRAYIAGEFAYLDTLFTDLKGRLANTYTLGFYVEPTGEPREAEVEIRVRRDRSQVDHRKFLVY